MIQLKFVFKCKWLRIYSFSNNQVFSQLFPPTQSSIYFFFFPCFGIGATSSIISWRLLALAGQQPPARRSIPKCTLCVSLVFEMLMGRVRTLEFMTTSAMSKGSAIFLLPDMMLQLVQSKRREENLRAALSLIEIVSMERTCPGDQEESQGESRSESWVQYMPNNNPTRLSQPRRCSLQPSLLSSCPVPGAVMWMCEKM